MLKAAHAVLVVVDVQGRLAEIVQDADQVVRKTRMLIEGAKVLEIPVLVTEQYPKGLGPTHPSIMEVLGESGRFEKSSFSCCGNHEFNTALMTLHRQDVILCGIETHVCVYQTAADLIDEGYTVHLVTDAVSSRTAENRRLGIERITALGGIPTSVEMALFEMLGAASGEAFKTISKLVK